MGIPYIPYFQTSRYRVQAMVDLAKVNRGLPAGRQEKAADLGTGDGRIAIALAKAGALVDAYELDDERIKEAKENVEKELGQFSTSPDTGRHLAPLEQYSSSEAKKNIENAFKGSHLTLTSVLSHRERKIKERIVYPTILKKDFWFEDLSKYSIICCYPMPTIMGRLEKKLQDELKPGSRVLLNYFPFTHWKLKETKDNIFLYIR